MHCSEAWGRRFGDRMGSGGGSGTGVVVGGLGKQGEVRNEENP